MKFPHECNDILVFCFHVQYRLNCPKKDSLKSSIQPCITALYKFYSDAFVYTFNWEGGQYFSSYLLQGLVVFTGGVLCSGALSNKRKLSSSLNRKI